jgi:eukaryotic-like serine/threonine-protein kinase
VIGKAIGSYQIIAELGRGGMGEVYRARDSKLNRDVALKVLPDPLIGDLDRLARFRREAQVLASLNHPNIAQVHGFEDAGGIHALVMELVEGPTLAERLAAGPIELDVALPIAKQIADALDAAHDQGIIHRDLKPANIKVRPDGTVKVLDFGLAKAVAPDGAGAMGDSQNSPTLTNRTTQMGMILGTAAYMAPEQARGRAVDRRADIWAFGVVLYEMLAGRRAFDGEDVSITLAGVLKEDVKWDALPADLPAAIRRLLRRCLEKDPKRRLAAIGDARLELEDAATPVEAVQSRASRPAIGNRERLMWAAVAGLATVSALYAFNSRTARQSEPPLTRFSIVPPGEGQFSGSPPRFSISPDGLFVVFAASSTASAEDRLWLRRLDSTEVTPIAGTESGVNGLAPQSPFWSPDGKRLAFFVQSDIVGVQGESRLRIVDLPGGRMQPVCDLPSNNAGGTWNADGVMLVSSQGSKGIQRIPAGGGVLAAVTTLDDSRKEVAHLFPQFLPDGRHFIYQALTQDRSSWATFVASIDSAAPRMLVQTDHARFAAPNLLLYVREENLLAQVMDLATMQLTGDPVVVATGLDARAGNGRAGFAVSDAGVLVYSSTTDPDQKVGSPNRQLTWVDRSGKVLGSVGTLTSISSLRLSPDGTHVALLDRPQPGAAASTGSVNAALWVTNLERNVRAPLTPATALATSATWSADGTRVLFGWRTADGKLTMVERAASGATPLTSIYEEAGINILPLDESADGKQVIFSRGQGGSRSLHIFSRPDQKPVAYLAGGFDYPQASLSRDGRWLAYVSNESGTYEVVVQPFPDPSRGKWPISSNGGLQPRWRKDGRELFYVDGDQRLVAVAMSVDRDLVPGTATVLFSLPVPRGPRIPGGASYVYDAAPDGQRFLVSIPTNSARTVPLTVTTNWMSLLKK